MLDYNPEKDSFWRFYTDIVQTELYMSKIFCSFDVINDFVRAEFNCACTGLILTFYFSFFSIVYCYIFLPFCISAIGE
jgi:uncharacterized membrane protein